ncbi:probable F-box protein At4g22030 [Typha angustifolia]|uniref:probable F-box protein At4g22030 n=1 Tax=Typha angustifolia TaxID=59011 RepID=UPI003C2F8EC2
MATLQAQSLFISSSSSSSSSSSRQRRRGCFAALHVPSNLSPRGVSFPKLSSRIQLEDLKIIEKDMYTANLGNHVKNPETTQKQDTNLFSKLYAVADAVADRAEMHAIIGEQRNNWNHLFLHSINSITLSATLMAGISSMATASSPQELAFKISSTLLFATACGMMLVVNKIQPSQLAEEQRKATQLWKQLQREIDSIIKRKTPTELDVEHMLEKVLALEKAYPLPLLPGMLEKFPKVFEPARWWPKRREQQKRREVNHSDHKNGWNKELEEEMRGALEVLKKKDEEQYVRLGKLVLDINQSLAISGPLFAGVAAISTGLIGLPAFGSWPVITGVVGGALAAIVNTLEHGGQVGMVFELYRNCSGYYTRLEEDIEHNLEEEEVEKRENGELFEMKMALQLGRSLSEMKDLAKYASQECKAEDMKEFAGKLF